MKHSKPTTLKRFLYDMRFFKEKVRELIVQLVLLEAMLSVGLFVPKETRQVYLLLDFFVPMMIVFPIMYLIVFVVTYLFVMRKITDGVLEEERKERLEGCYSFYVHRFRKAE